MTFISQKLGLPLVKGIICIKLHKDSSCLSTFESTLLVLLYTPLTVALNETLPIFSLSLYVNIHASNLPRQSFPPMMKYECESVWGHLPCLRSVLVFVLGQLFFKLLSQGNYCCLSISQWAQGISLFLQSTWPGNHGCEWSERGIRLMPWEWLGLVLIFALLQQTFKVSYNWNGVSGKAASLNVRIIVGV